MTYQRYPEYPDADWTPEEEAEDESPYPHGPWQVPVIVLLVFLTGICCALAFVSLNPGWALVFGLVVPFCLWVAGMWLVRGSKRHAENVDHEDLCRAVAGWEVTQFVTHHISRYLRPGERVLLFCHRHPIVILGKRHPWAGLLVALLWAALTAVMLRVELPLVAGCMVLGALAVLSVRWLIWRDEWFCLTSSRFIRIHGLVNRKVNSMKYEKITNVDSDIPFSGRLLAWLRFIWSPYGHILIQAADAEEGEEPKKRPKNRKKPRKERKSRPNGKQKQPPLQAPIRYLPRAAIIVGFLLGRRL